MKNLPIWEFPEILVTRDMATVNDTPKNRSIPETETQNYTQYELSDNQQRIKRCE